MLQFQSLTRPTLLLSAALTAVACAPKDEQLTNYRGGNNNVTIAALEGREVNYARHTFLKVGEVRRMMDIALALPERASLPIGKPRDLSGKCRSLKRLSPAPDLGIPAFSEKVQVNYFKCEESSENIAQAQKTGPEMYFVSYGAALPTDGGNLPYPTSVVVQAQDIGIRMIARTKSGKDKVEVNQNASLNAELVADDGANLTYSVWYDSADSYNYNVQLLMRSGEVATHLKRVEVKVDKASRKVVSVDAPEMGFEAHLEQYDKSDLRGTALQNHKYKNVYLTFKSKESLKISANVCDAPTGVYAMTDTSDRNDPKSSTVTVGEGKVSVQGQDDDTAGSMDIKLCKDQSDEPSFLEDLESVYF